MSTGPAETVTRILAVAATQPDRLAVADPAQRLSYEELIGAARRAAVALRADGVALGDRVGLISENSADYLVAAVGTWMAGAILAPIHPAFGASELDYVLTNAEPRLVLVQEGQGAEMAGREVAVRPLERLADRGPGGEDTAPVDVDPAATALIYYTSGSTGRPKPVAHSHAGIAAGTLAFTRVWHLGPEDRTLVCLPMSWAFGLTTGSIATLLGGGAVIVLPRYNPVRVTEAIGRERVTVFHGVTTMFVKMLEYVREGGDPPPSGSLRLCVSGGEPRNEPAFEQWRELTGCSIYDNYCASECWPVVTHDPWEEAEPQTGSAGRVAPGSALRILDEDGAEVDPGEVGEGVWRAPGQMVGYWNEPQLTAAAFTADGWFHSRDLVRMDETGHVFVVGRVADTIIRGGNNISPAEVEAVLAGHEDIGDVAVVGVPDPIYGEAVAAAVVPAPGAELDPEGLADLCRAEMAAFKVPTRFRQVVALPRNANGKLQRREVAPLIDDEAVSVEPTRASR